jgi:hypothetical protein
MERMGWGKGEGLGKDRAGMTEPILVEVKVDKKGVGLPSCAMKRDQAGDVNKPTSVDARHEELGGVMEVPGIQEVPGRPEYGEGAKAYQCLYCNVRLASLKLIGDHCQSKKHRRASPRNTLYAAPQALKKAGLQSEKDPVSRLLEVAMRCRALQHAVIVLAST